MKSPPIRSFLLAVVFMLTACTFDGYETGDGELSRVRADFGVATSNASRLITGFVSDEGERFAFATPLSADWIITPDSTYRVQVYYNNTGEKTVTTHAVNPVGTLIPRVLKEDEAQKTDPLTLTSAWLSTNSAYINLALTLKLGSADGKSIDAQKMGLAIDHVDTAADGTRHHHLRLMHDQCGVPEYFSQTVYVSIPIEECFATADKVSILINTYNGEVIKTFDIP